VELLFLCAYLGVLGDLAASSTSHELLVRDTRDSSMTNVRLSLPTVLILLAVVGAGAFAAGQSTSTSSSPSLLASPPPPEPTPMAVAENEDPTDNNDLLPPGHPPTTGAAPGQLPAGHPPVDSVDRAGPKAPAPGAVVSDEAPFEWRAPARWQLVVSANSMRIATYRVPHAPGDSEDPELSVVQAGGSVDANAERWIGQFDSASQKTAKRSMRKVGSLDVAMVEVQGSYSGGMGKESSPRAGWALLGAIAPTSSLPCFFKLTGPAKSVLAARPEFDALIASLTAR
jgi:hypothetical protein